MRHDRGVWLILGTLLIAMMAASVALIGLWRNVTGLEQANAILRRQLVVAQRSASDQQSQIQALQRALQRCHRTHGRRCERPQRSTPTPTAGASASATGSPSPQPTRSASVKPRPSRSPRPAPRPSSRPSPTPTPSPSCLVTVSRICLQ